MPHGRVGPCLLLGGSLLLACGERTGDAVIALPPADEMHEMPDGGGEGSGGVSGTSGGGTSGGGTGALLGPSGLCAPCDTSRQCGDADDACILHGSERFCGRDCDGPGDCPGGYSCVALSNSPLLQCVPDGGCPAPAASPPPLGAIRDALLERINEQRLAQSRASLEGSPCLDDIAQQSALDFARADAPFGKFLEECEPVWPACVCGWRAQAELSVARLGLDWQAAVDAALSARDDAPGSFARAYLSTGVSAVGIGFWLSGDEAWVALSLR